MGLKSYNRNSKLRICTFISTKTAQETCKQVLKKIIKSKINGNTLCNELGKQIINPIIFIRYCFF